VGSEDVFGLFRGTDFLHNILMEKNIPHEYQFLLGVDHVGNSIPPRIESALAFLHRMRSAKRPDPYLERFRALVLEEKERAGLASQSNR